MVYTTLKAFAEAVPYNHYAKNHTWFNWEGVAFNLVSAWRLYKRAQQPVLGFLLLGDTKIRKDPTLVSAFGLMSAGGIKERAELEMVAALKIQSRWRKTGPSNFRNGSILSDQNWSPLLNDSLILAGVHRKKEFHFVDGLLSGYNFQKPTGMAGVRAEWKMRDNAAQNRLADLSQRPWEIQVWRRFFQEHKSVLWDSTNQIPRVLARELIGLMTFGYKAMPTAQQLSFVPEADTAAPGFETYLGALRQAGYFSGKETTMLSRISNFIFGHPEAIR
jgi:hypothetical protein